MRNIGKLGAGSGVVIGLAGALSAVAGAPFAAAAPGGEGTPGVVFVQTDNPAGNQVVAYHRAPDGALSLAARYGTGGVGGVLEGSVVDHLASQGSLTDDPADGLLFAVNAGSNSVSVFAVVGDGLVLRQVVPSNGVFPVSVAVSGDLVYVLNALGGGSVSGYRVAGGRLQPIQGSTVPLGLATPSNATQFTHTPGQVAFSPDGSQLIVTTKAAANTVDVFGVEPSGRLSSVPVVNALPGAVPFAVAFDAAGHLLVSEAGPDALAAFTLERDGTLTPIDTVATGQAATCWVTPDRGVFFASNAGSASLSRIAESPFGQLRLLGTTATDPGTVDAAVAAGGQYLYVQTGGEGIVDEFRVGFAGTLTEIGSVTVPGAVGGEGIVAF
jgi:6-phosphogluconolactonase (cycloisomerase 2 family)